MIESQGVTVPELLNDTGCYCLLADSKVHLTRYLSLPPELSNRFFKKPTPQHQAIEQPHVGLCESLHFRWYPRALSRSKMLLGPTVSVLGLHLKIVKHERIDVSRQLEGFRGAAGAVT